MLRSGLLSMRKAIGGIAVAQADGEAGVESGRVLLPIAGGAAPAIRRAERSDLGAIERLLTANNLPKAGVHESLDHFIVATDRDVLLGAIGLEPFGDAALLRSAVVDRESRSTGIGARLVEEVMALARELNVRELYLLTTTAESYFPRFGFVHTTRDVVPEGIRGSVEFRGACPASATVMVASVKRADAPRQQPEHAT